jgi:transcriptional regulator with XRE-family HTH domain
MTPGDRIREACESTGLSQSEVARRIGVKIQQLQQIVRGEVIRSKHLPAIANALGVDVAWLVSGNGPAPAWAVSHTATSVAEPPPEHVLVGFMSDLRDQMAAMQKKMDALMSLLPPQAQPPALKTTARVRQQYHFLTPVPK